MRIADNYQSMGFGLSYADKVETTCRFLIKACGHALFSAKEPIQIDRILFDGNAHHEDGIDPHRLTKGFERDLRSYVRLGPGFAIDDIGRRHRDESSRLAIDFADNVVSGWRSIISGCTDTSHITAPLKDILQRAQGSMLHVNKHSRWFRRLLFSEFMIMDEKPAFPNMFRPDEQQGCLF